MHYIISQSMDEAYRYAQKNLKDVAVRDITVVNYYEVLEGLTFTEDDKIYILRNVDEELIRVVSSYTTSRGFELKDLIVDEPTVSEMWG